MLRGHSSNSKVPGRNALPPCIAWPLCFRSPHEDSASLQSAGSAPYELDTYDGAYQDLPSVDDLEVAAAAAAAAMEVDMTSNLAESDEEVCPVTCCFAGL